VSFRNGNPEIYVSKFDGSNQRNLTNNPAADDQPAWFPVYDNSPNGIIALITDRDTPGTGELNLYVINPDGTGLQRLTNFTGEELDLSLSPDLTRFLLTYGPVTGPWHIYMMNRNGTGLTQLTTEGQNRYPAWRPR
jgi:Tol biopolymer transport system component